MLFNHFQFFKSSVSHDPSDIILMICCSRKISYYYQHIETAQYFCGKCDKNMQVSLVNKEFKSNLFEIEIFSSTFDQFNASLPNKSISFS